MTRRPKGPFVVSWPKQLGEKNVITICRAPEAAIYTVYDFEPQGQGALLLSFHVIGRAWYGMENGMQQKFRYGIWKMPEWNGMEDNLAYFHTGTNSILLLDSVHCIYRKTYTVQMLGSDTDR